MEATRPGGARGKTPGLCSRIGGLEILDQRRVRFEDSLGIGEIAPVRRRARADDPPLADRYLRQHFDVAREIRGQDSDGKG